MHVSRLLEILFWAFAGSALVLSLLAWRNVAAETPEAWFRNVWRVFTRGLHAEREVYTARGWRYRNLSLVAGALAVVALLLTVFIG